MERMLQAGAGQCLDGVALHAYGFTFPPDDPADPREVNLARAELLHNLLLRYGVDVPGYITEGGWNDHPRWTHAVRPYQRLEYTVRAYAKALEEWPWCRAVGLWVFRYPWPQKNYQDAFAFVTPEFIPKPVYIEVQNYAHGRPYEYLEPSFMPTRTLGYSAPGQ
jgi:polysaccharide biosynthesis protein PslG